MPRLILILPPLVLAAIGLLMWYGMGLDPNGLPSPFLAKPLPKFSASTLAEPPAILTNQDIKGPALLNFWASWCAACRDEHPLLLAVARKKDVAIYGVDYLDLRDPAQVWLNREGDPYRQIVFDDGGTLGNTLGVLGTPETYAIDAGGVVRYRHVGALTPEVWEKMREAMGLGRGSGL
ncbi:DsbE family thiol:disulfide interchange protein [Methylomagnum sp.]